MRKLKEKIAWTAVWRIDRFRDPDDTISNLLQRGLTVHEVRAAFPELHEGHTVFKENLALNEGIQELFDIICGLGAPTKWDNTNARIGVGDSSAGEVATQVGLQGSNKSFKAMDATYPQRTAQAVEWRSTFGTDEGNHAWEEFTIVNAADDSGKNLNRKCEPKGTKASGETWTVSLSITLS